MASGRLRAIECDTPVGGIFDKRGAAQNIDAIQHLRLKLAAQFRILWQDHMLQRGLLIGCFQTIDERAAFEGHAPGFQSRRRASIRPVSLHIR